MSFLMFDFGIFSIVSFLMECSCMAPCTPTVIVMTTVDNQSWISIHTYVVTNFYREPILILLELLMEGSSADRLAITIVDSLQVMGD